MAASMSMRST
jgi:hypothetical protein